MSSNIPMVKIIPRQHLTSYLNIMDIGKIDPGSRITYLVDFYDWLVYIASIHRENSRVMDFHIKNEEYYLGVFHDYREFIELNRFRLDDKKTNIILSQRIDLKRLLECYINFTLEIEQIQKSYLQNYTKVNVNTWPRFIIPFSMGLNRLATGHLVMDQLSAECENTVDVHKGKLVDSCQRLTKFWSDDFAIMTYSVKTNLQEKNRLPISWRLQVAKDAKGEIYTPETPKATDVKYRQILDIYSQYIFVGFATIDNQDVFLLNYPFLQETLKIDQPTGQNHKPEFVDKEKDIKVYIFPKMDFSAKKLC